MNAYVEGWQSWTPPVIGPAVDGFEARGLLVVAADGPVEELEAKNSDAALAAVAERLAPAGLRPVPPGWCSWSQYFHDVTAADVIENVGAAVELELPIEIVQVDDGWQAGIGDWLDLDPRFGSLADMVAGIDAAGMRAGIWVAPFLVGDASRLAAEHPDRLVQGADAGWNWGQSLGALDVSVPAAAEHLAHVFRTIAGWGFSYFKIDFLFAGALRDVDTYREGLRIIRDAVGPDAIVLGCGSSRASASSTRCASAPTCCRSRPTRRPTSATSSVPPQRGRG